MMLRLPLPPTTNNLFGNPPRPHMRRPPTAIYKAWQVEAWEEMKRQKPEPLPHGCRKFTFQLLVNDKTRGDVSNRIKAAEDFCVTHALCPDDRYAVRATAERSAEVPPGWCYVYLEEHA